MVTTTKQKVQEAMNGADEGNDDDECEVEDIGERGMTTGESSAGEPRRLTSGDR